MKAAVKKRAARKPASKQPIRVAMLEGDPLRFEGLRALFGSQAEFSVRSSTAPMLLKALDDDVVLMTSNRGAAFYSAMSALKAMRPSVRIIVTGPSGNDEDILRAIAASWLRRWRGRCRRRGGRCCGCCAARAAKSWTGRW